MKHIHNFRIPIYKVTSKFKYQRMQGAIKRIGWIGTGVMGKSMCDHLLNAGYELCVFNRTKSKTDELVAKGAKFMAPSELAKSCDAVVLMLGYPKDIETVVLESDGLIHHMKPGTLLIDHTTSSPSLAQKIYEYSKQKGIDSIDAPVSGGDVGARNGKLVIMCGGDQTAFDKAVPIFQKYGTNIKLLGKAGQGQNTKMVNQIVIANNMMGVVEGLNYGYKAGLDLNLVLETIGAGAAGSFSLNVLGPRMLKRDFDPGFFVEHFVKDMAIALEECRRMNICLPGLAQANQFYQALMAHGGARLGTQGLLLVLEKLNNIDLSKQIGKKYD